MFDWFGTGFTTRVWWAWDLFQVSEPSSPTVKDLESVVERSDDVALDPNRGELGSLTSHPVASLSSPLF